MAENQHSDKIQSDVPPFEIFRQEIKKIYPEGDLSKTYQRILWYIENEKICSDGCPLTYQLIMVTFAAHIRQWNSQYGSRDPKYIGRPEEEKRKNLWDFVGLRWYEREFVISSAQGERNKYLFGTFDIPYLQELLHQFKRQISDETTSAPD